MSERPRALVATLAAGLGVNQVVGELNPDAKAEFLRGCRQRGATAVFVGDCGRNPVAAAEAGVAIALSSDLDLEDLLNHAEAPVIAMGARVERLDVLWEVAASRAQRVKTDQAIVMVPNIFCVAGAFLFGFTGLTSVVVSNLGTFGVYNRAAGSLRCPDRHGRRVPKRWHQAAN
jgi:Cu2+-exporting ATPase